MRRAVLLLVLCVATLAVTGCGQLGRIEDDVSELNATAKGHQRDQKIASEQLDEIQSALASEGITSDEDRASILSRFSAMERTLTQLEARVEEQDDLLRRIQASLDVIAAGAGNQRSMDPALADSLGGTGGELPVGESSSAGGGALAAGAAVGAAVGSGLSDDEPPPLNASGSPGAEVYDAAFRDFTRGSFTLAREGFQEFLDRYPETDLADNARYWVGETWYAQGNYREAVDHFDAVLRQYPEGDILPAALLKASNCRFELAEEDRALEGYRRLMEEYPESDEAFIAQHKIAEIAG